MRKSKNRKNVESPVCKPEVKGSNPFAGSRKIEIIFPFRPSIVGNDERPKLTRDFAPVIISRQLDAAI
jgi:hypothetical protein